MKTFEQLKFKRKETLGEYLHKRTLEGLVNCHKTWCKIPDVDDLAVFIQQYKIKEGHTEWSDDYQKNIWIEDED